MEQAMNKIYNNILETIGSTPVVRINKLAPEHVNLFVKVEAFNPMGSVKDRMALSTIEASSRALRTANSGEPPCKILCATWNAGASMTALAKS